MGVVSLPSFVAGERIEPDSAAPRVRSLDGSFELPVAESSSVQLRRALRYGDLCQERLAEIPLEQRLGDVRLVVREYARRAADACFALAHFRGIVARDTRWMCQLNLDWANDLEPLLTLLFSGAAARAVHAQAGLQGQLSWASKGKACLFSSATMDGPAAVVALCHAMISGTHLILRPSFRDAATQLAFETLIEHDLGHYAQLVRWRSEASEAPQLNRQLLGNVAQGLVFSSNETFRSLLDGAAIPGTSEWDALHARTHRYGTGLPVAIVTAQADLDAAARDLVEAARLGGGRFCLSAGPVLVERSCQQALLERLVEHARQLRHGPPLDEQSDLSSLDHEGAGAMRAAVDSLGGKSLFGAIGPRDMDVVILADVPTGSAALHRELPGPVLSIIPVENLATALEVASSALRANHRQAWTAAVLFGSPGEFATLQKKVQSFRYLHGGVVSRVKLLLPHQGSYFAIDLMRRVSVES